MSERILPDNYARGALQGLNVIGEVTEALHRFLIDGWEREDAPMPRIEEDLAFVPKDREEVLYIYMYRVAQNTALMNSKRLRLAKISLKHSEGDEEMDQTFWERPPLYLDVHYLIAVHSKFRSDAERLLGWVLLRLHEATHLLYRPRRYLLPSGETVDSMGRPWTEDAFDDELIMEKVALSLVDDLTVGDAINFFTIHEAPFRPYVTYKARCALEGALISGPPHPVKVDYPPLEQTVPGSGQPTNPNQPTQPRTVGRKGRMLARPTRRTTIVEPEPNDEK